MRWLAMAVALVVGACATVPSEPPTDFADTAGEVRLTAHGPEQFRPTRLHRAAYEMMEDCTNRSGQFEDIRWFAALSIRWVSGPREGEEVKALWTRERGPREIIFDRRWMWDGTTISHEALHDLYDGDVPMDVAERCLLRPRLLMPDDEGQG